MVFNSLHFVWFFVVVYALYRCLPHRPQNFLLLAASYYFYAAWDWRFLGLLLASTVVDYTAAILIEGSTVARRRKAFLAISLTFNLTLLGFFKYFNFFAENLYVAFSTLGWNLDFVTVRVLLPIGISFYTFMTMSYVIDVYRREIAATRDLLDFAVFISYFPHLVAGPILRAANLLPQIDRPRRISAAQVREGLWLILWGSFQKVFVADNLAIVANAVFEPGAGTTGANVLIGVYAFAFQIYGDFAGYSNIARGISKLMGIELIENFRFPYFVRTPQQFWRHWHISLSSWLRDYLYIPLGGNRGSERRTRANLFMTMLLGGLWHGAAWTFLLWGVYQGVLLMTYRAASRMPSMDKWLRARAPMAVLTSWFVMFHLTCYGWVIFRARSLRQIGEMTTSLIRDFALASTDVSGLLVPTLMYAMPLVLLDAVLAVHNDALVVLRLPLWARYSVYAGALYLTLLFGNFGGAEFIYFQF